MTTFQVGDVVKGLLEFLEDFGEDPLFIPEMLGYTGIVTEVTPFGYLVVAEYWFKPEWLVMVTPYVKLSPQEAMIKKIQQLETKFKNRKEHN